MVRLAGELRGGMGEETQVADGARDLDLAGEPDGLAAIARFGVGELLELRLQRVGKTFEPAGAFERRQCGPRGKGTPCRVDGARHVLGIAFGDLRECRARGGIEYVAPSAIGRIRCCAVDPVLETHPPSLTRGFGMRQVG